MGKKVYLRPLESAELNLDDLDWLNDRASAIFDRASGFPVTFARFEQLLPADPARGLDLVLAVVDTASDNRIGAVTLSEIDWRVRTARTDIALAHGRHWEAGLAGEAWALLIEHAFRALRLRKLIATADAQSADRVAELEKLGFRLEATLRAEAFIEGKFVDVMRFSLFDEALGHAE